MGTRLLETPQTPVREHVIVAGSFAPDTASAPTDLRGVGFTVAYVSTGLFTVTFDKVWPEVISAVATMQLAAAADTKAQIGVIDLQARTMQIRIITTASVANVAANANNRVNFVVHFKNTGLAT